MAMIAPATASTSRAEIAPPAYEEVMNPTVEGSENSVAPVAIGSPKLETETATRGDICELEEREHLDNQKRLEALREAVGELRNDMATEEDEHSEGLKATLANSSVYLER